MLFRGGYLDDAHSLISKLRGLIREIFPSFEFKDDKTITAKDLSNLRNQIRKLAPEERTKALQLIGEELSKSYLYLKTVDPISYIKNKYPGIGNFKIVNAENYVIHTIQTTENGFHYFRIKEDGEIEEYSGSEVHHDGDINQIMAVVGTSELEMMYYEFFQHFSSYTSFLLKYYQFSQLYVKYARMNISYFLDHLFNASIHRVEDNDVVTLHVNKSYGNVLNQMVYTSDIAKLIDLINDRRKITDGKIVDLHKFEGRPKLQVNDHLILESKIDLIHIKDQLYDKLYNEMITRTFDNEDDYIKTLTLSIGKFFKDQPKMIDGLNKIVTSIINDIRKYHLISQSLITTYNASIYLNIVHQFKTKELGREDLIPNIINIINLGVRSRENIKFIIMTRLLFMMIPIYTYPFNERGLLAAIFLYIYRLIREGSNYGINTKYLYRKIFKEYTSASDDVTYLNLFTESSRINQCTVSYMVGNNIVSHTTCAESTLLNILVIMFYTKNSLDEKKLSKFPKIDKGVLDFLKKHPNTDSISTIIACQDFAKLVTNIPGIDYLKEVDNYNYDLSPTFRNVSKLLFYLLTGDLIEASNEEYKRIYQKYFGIVELSQNDAQTILLLESIKCIFGNQHAEVLAPPAMPWKPFMDMEIYIYFTYFLRKNIDTIRPLLREQDLIEMTRFIVFSCIDIRRHLKIDKILTPDRYATFLKSLDREVWQRQERLYIMEEFVIALGIEVVDKIKIASTYIRLPPNRGVELLAEVDCYVNVFANQISIYIHQFSAQRYKMRELTNTNLNLPLIIENILEYYPDRLDKLTIFFEIANSPELNLIYWEKIHSYALSLREKKTYIIGRHLKGVIDMLADEYVQNNRDRIERTIGVLSGLPTNIFVFCIPTKLSEKSIEEMILEKFQDNLQSIEAIDKGAIKVVFQQEYQLEPIVEVNWESFLMIPWKKYTKCPLEEFAGGYYQKYLKYKYKYLNLRRIKSHL